jgi:hypothetical protein
VNHHVLLIYEYVPDRTQIYNLSINDEILDKLTQCHGHYGNTENVPDDHPVHNWLPDYLQKLDSSSIIFDTDSGSKKSPAKLNGDLIVIHSGFML